jgi:hypothetical protein
MYPIPKWTDTCRQRPATRWCRAAREAEGPLSTARRRPASGWGGSAPIWPASQPRARARGGETPCSEMRLSRRCLRRPLPPGPTEGAHTAGLTGSPGLESCCLFLRGSIHAARPDMAPRHKAERAPDLAAGPGSVPWPFRRLHAAAGRARVVPKLSLNAVKPPTAEETAHPRTRRCLLPLAGCTDGDRTATRRANTSRDQLEAHAPLDAGRVGPLNPLPMPTRPNHYRPTPRCNVTLSPRTPPELSTAAASKQPQPARLEGSGIPTGLFCRPPAVRRPLSDRLCLSPVDSLAPGRDKTGTKNELTAAVVPCLICPAPYMAPQFYCVDTQGRPPASRGGQKTESKPGVSSSAASWPDSVVVAHCHPRVEWVNETLSRRPSLPLGGHHAPKDWPTNRQ